MLFTFSDSTSNTEPGACPARRDGTAVRRSRLYTGEAAFVVAWRGGKSVTVLNEAHAKPRRTRRKPSSTLLLRVRRNRGLLKLRFDADDPHTLRDVFIGAYIDHLILPKMGAYAVAKAAIEPLVAVLRKENPKLRFTIVRPGAVDTDLWNNAPFKKPASAKTPICCIRDSGSSSVWRSGDLNL